ncbi:hypothetical protein GLA29479_1608 [Lysobacter antibioticus]|jgi:hypothetical protein|nr:hypothetical protein GLA29479_1608 [Lysobacter antibioticus]
MHSSDRELRSHIAIASRERRFSAGALAVPSASPTVEARFQSAPQPA